MKASLQSVARKETKVTSVLQRMDMQMLREIIKYLGARQVVGTSILRARDAERQVHLWTTDDGERLLLLIQQRRVQYWIATQEHLDLLRSRACDWLSEPPMNPQISVPHSTG